MAWGASRALPLLLLVPVAAAQDRDFLGLCASNDTDCLAIAVVGFTAIVLALVIAAVVVIFLRARSPKPIHRTAPRDAPRPADPRKDFVFIVDDVPDVTFPLRHEPWPDEDAPRRRTSSAPPRQVRWGPYRLFLHDGRYFWSRDSGQGKEWDAVGQIPKGHRVVADADGVPRLEPIAGHRRG